VILGPLVLLGLLCLITMTSETSVRSLVPVVAVILAAAGLAVALGADPYDVTVPARIAGLATVPYAMAAVAGALAWRTGPRVVSTVVMSLAAIGLSAVVPGTVTEYGIAVVVGTAALTLVLLHRTARMARRR
jgi:hypothetical protein